MNGLTPYKNWPLDTHTEFDRYETLCGNNDYVWLDRENGRLRLARVKPYESFIAIVLMFVADPLLVRKMYTYGARDDVEATVTRTFDPPIPLHEAMHIAETFVLMGFFNEVKA